MNQTKSKSDSKNQSKKIVVKGKNKEKPVLMPCDRLYG